MKFFDLADFNTPENPGVRGVNFESDDRWWRVTAVAVVRLDSNGDPHVDEWAVYQALGGGQILRRVPWFTMRTREEGFAMVHLLSSLPATGSLTVAKRRAQRVTSALVERVVGPVREPVLTGLLAVRRWLRGDV